MPKLRQIQAPILSTDLELSQNMNRESGIDRSEFNWIDIGYVYYGMQNDEGYSRIYIKLGVRRDAKNKYRPTLVEVVEKYYTCTGNYDYEEYEMHHSPRKASHGQDIVYYKCPRDFNKVLETVIGKDTRTKIEKEY